MKDAAKKISFSLMNRILLTFVLMLVCGAATGAKSRGNKWARHTFSAPADTTYKVALKVIAQRYELQYSEDNARIIQVHVNPGRFSNGYDFTLVIEPTGEKSSRARLLTLDRTDEDELWLTGTGSREIKKLWRWMEDRLRANRTENPVK